MKSKNNIPVREPNKRNVKTVEDLKNFIKTKKTILMASIKNLPASQFQEISKKLRGKAIVTFPKKNLILRALDSSSKEAIKDLKEKVEDSVVILFSDLDSFELAGELLNNKTPSKGKVGQEAPEDIEVPAGPTDLIPGPAISELGALGIKIQIEKGKITIKEPKVIAKEGEKISSGAVELMGKLDIKPFSVGFIPLCAFDNEEGKFYAELNIDKEGTLEELKTAYGKSLPFAVEIGYSSEETIKFLIGKAGVHEKILENLKPAEVENNLQSPKEDEAVEEEKDTNEIKEEKIEETQTPKENKQEGEEK
ncbi:50S ribosomal protein L10 [Candidatus Pacearchaeota archaeon]|nr:50S ribosomal protein L10 [Candidatus Pacearchaeota archaeon]